MRIHPPDKVFGPVAANAGFSTERKYCPFLRGGRIILSSDDATGIYVLAPAKECEKIRISPRSERIRIMTLVSLDFDPSLPAQSFRFSAFGRCKLDANQPNCPGDRTD
jgi:hypothetical protein